jgi:hypothetical protein
MPDAANVLIVVNQVAANSLQVMGPSGLAMHGASVGHQARIDQLI